MSAILRARALTVDHRVGPGHLRALDGVDMEIEEGETFGLVGPSGSGKSTLAQVLTRYLPRGSVLSADTLRVAGRDLRRIDGAALREYRRKDIGIVYQEPSRALNPTSPVGAQIAEVHGLRGGTRRAARHAAVDALGAVGLDDAPEIARRYAHELSGGQQQRVMIAMALSARPRLVVLDEPTTGLDALVRTEVMELIRRLQAEQGFATLLISHDLAFVAAHCARVGMLDAGQLVRTTHALTLDNELPPVRTRRQRPDDDRAPEPHPAQVLTASGLRKRYGSHVALDGVDVSLRRGETLGIIGETGSGKTTLGLALAGLVSVEGGVVVDAPDVPRPVQTVFQSPEASLNPRKTVRQTLRRAITLRGGDTTPVRLAELMGLPHDALDRLPSQLSGGQKQRVAIARAFAGDTQVVVCDEPTSSLDPDVQARILDLLIELQERTGVAYLFISHDLAAIRRIAHRVAVMRRGRILETAPVDTLFHDATHPYTRALLGGRTLDREPE